MANIIGIEVSGDTYDLEDSQARQDIQTNSQDIDGIEEKIPSSTSTSNKLVDEQKFSQATTNQDIDLTCLQGYTVSLANITSRSKCGSVECGMVRIKDVSGDRIGTTVTATAFSSPLRPKTSTAFLLYDFVNRAVARAVLNTDGTIGLAESLGVVSGSNELLGEVIFLS